MNIKSTPEVDHALDSLTTEGADLLLRIYEVSSIGLAICRANNCQCGKSLHDRISRCVEKCIADKLFCNDDIPHLRTILSEAVKIAADITRKSTN